MAMFLSRIKKALNLGTKNITVNGTYNASSDGYDGYSSVEVNVAGVTPTPVTPSNASPAALTSGSAVTPTANGYAIQSYEEIDVPKPSHHYTIRPDMPTISRVGALEGVEQLHFHSIDPSNSDPDTITDGEIYIADGSGVAVASVTDVIPSSTPTSVSMDDVVHIQGSGVIVDSIPIPPSLTPSNATPASITSGNSYTATGNGYAIESYSSITNSPLDVSANDMLKVNVSGKVAMLQTITPSNTNPPEIDYLGGYIPTTSGYVVRRYDSVTPSSTPEAVTAGDMVQINGSGVIVDSIPTPTSLTPSNSSPATITSGETYTATANGKAVSSVTDITPSNSSPVSLSSGSIYKPSASGYAISSYSSKTPSDSSPASVSSGAIIKASASGYLYSTVQPKVKTGTVTLSTSGTTTVTCGFEPKYIALMVYKDATHYSESIYNEDVSISNTYRGAINGGSSGCGASSFPVTSTSTAGLIMSTSSTGFKVAAASTAHGTNGYYFAIG